ncbi:polymorphic toxin type 28 domain-containing protein [Micromonospora sp. LOL_025]|uniref:polymorphic toxin type 28 domain-containing protein n=1 Tax=Micromonospora sp. LOL_025 TaxID=3345413 RepID=UPI003A8BABDD
MIPHSPASSLSAIIRKLKAKKRRRGSLAAAVAVTLVAGLLQSVPAQAAPTGYQPTSAKPIPTVPVKTVKPATVPAAKLPPPASTKPASAWPPAGTAVVDLTGARPDASPARAGTLPVRIARPAASARSTAPPGRVRVEVLDRATTERAGVRGLLLKVERADGNAASGKVDLTVDYASFATAYGADWASRLRLVSLPDCALKSPEKKQCAGTPLPSHNDPTARTVSADVPARTAQTMIAVSAAPSGPAGDYSATPLQASSTWSAGGNSGAFTWSYPMRVPPTPGGLEPQVELSYSSQSVDGRHAASNNQPSWVGEGFEAWPGGFIERRYKACASDMDGSANNNEKTGDLCWETDNAVLSLNGSSGELIYNATENRWHLRSDDGSRIERKSGARNGDNNGEYWVVTNTNGTQYWFGINRLPGWASTNPETNSTWTVPVFSNDPGEPCHAADFADSDCVEAWRWNLDYVVDVHGNSLSYWYGKETNKYGRNLDPDDDTIYDRGGWLDRIDYGTRRVNGVDSVLSTPAPFRVDLGEANRCLSNCTTHTETQWPDTPWDSECTGSSCADKFAPTFWTTKRLSTVTTQVRNGSGYENVERWTLSHTFPDPGDGTRAGLWLNKISHAGLVGATTSLPDIEFTPVQLSNRVDTIDFAEAMNWMRITKIRNETGGTLSINYSKQDCQAGQTMPSPHTNSRRCYPVIWEPEGYANPVTDWFNKYVVDTIYENDNTGGVPPQGSKRVAYKYTYLDGVAWHYNDDDGLIDKKNKTWSDYRGYGRVGVTVGDPGEQTYTETRYFRGMHGDKLAPTGGIRTATIDGINDEDWFAGMTRETKTFNGPDGPVVERELSTPWGSAATATRTINGDTVTARFNRTGIVTKHAVLDAGRGERVTKTVTSYDVYGMTVSVDDLGQDGVNGDEQCTKTDYTPRNTTDWLMDRAHRVQTYAVKCADITETLADDDVIGETRTTYDDHNFEAEPERGLPTRTEHMSAWNNGAPTFTTVGRVAYDVHGRVTSTWDANNYETKTAYTPTTGGPVTAVTRTNPMLHVTTTTLNPAWGLATVVRDANDKQTELAYDGLGRLSSVWLPGRARATETASVTFGYQIRNDSATAVSTSELDAAGNYITSHTLYDGLMRERQTQSASPSGGRLLTDTFYDTAGRPVKTFDSYHATGTAGTTLVTATERALVPTQTRTEYDGAGRTTASIFQPYDAERWRTTTYYAGDRTDVTPPAGGTATSTHTDALGRTAEIRQYHGAAPTPGTTGSWDATTYTFNRKGQMTQSIDARGNKWTYTFDIWGRQIEVSDPDKGKTISTYDNGGRVTTITDARGKKLAYGYDPLNRKRGVYENQIGGTPRALWFYDTLAKGQLTQSNRYVNGAAYQVKVSGYTDSYQPTGTVVVIPTSETGIAGTYTFGTSYKVDGSVASQGMPSTNADLPEETLLFDYNSYGLQTGMRTLYDGVESSYVVDTDYNALAEVDQMELYTGFGGRVFQKYTRELETGRLTGIRTDRDSVTPNILADIQYRYDKTGNITRIADVTPDPVDDTQCFTYDHLRRLTEAWTPSSGDCAETRSATALGGPAPYWQSWTFDNIGNRRTETVHTATGNTTTTYNYPADGTPKPHSLTSTTGGQVGSYTYDETGNTLTRPNGSSATQTLTWDSEGHLDTATDSTGQTSFVYDANGNRLIRRDPTGKTLYLPGQEIRYNSATNTTTCTRYYSYNGVTIASRTAAGLTWLAGDHHGTAGVSVEAATQQSKIRRETPFGQPRGSNPTWPNDKGFLGGTKDPTGLTHLGAREYDPSIGRFISVDPVMDLTDPQQWNAYAYSNNSPATFSDPSGLIDTDCLTIASCPDYRPGDEKGNRKNKAKNPGCWPRCSGSKDPRRPSGGTTKSEPPAIGPIVLHDGDVYDPDELAHQVETERAKLLAAGGRLSGHEDLDAIRLLLLACNSTASTRLCSLEFQAFIDQTYTGLLDVYASESELGPMSVHSPTAAGSDGRANPIVRVPHFLRTTKSGRIVGDHLQPKDLGAAKRELRGEVVARKADGTPWNHVAEVRDAQRGLLKRVNSIKDRMRFGQRMTVDERVNLQVELSYASRMLDYSYKYVPPGTA